MGKDKRIINTVAMMEQSKAASPKGEINGLSVQRESNYEERGRKERELKIEG